LRVFLLKTLLGLAVALMSGAIAIFILFAFRHWTFDGFNSFLDVSGSLVPSQLPAGLLLAFSISVLIAAFSIRIVSTVALSLAITCSIFLGIVLFWRGLDFKFWDKQVWMAASASVVALVLLGASIYFLTRNCSKRLIRYVVQAAVVLLLTTTLTCGLLLLIYLRIEFKDIYPYFSAINATGDHVLAHASAGDGWSEVWVLPVNPKARKKAVRRLTTGARFSPDGEWIVYYSNENCLGLRSDSVSLRACRIDGSDDRELVPDFAGRHPGLDTNECSGGITFSPDGRQVIMNCGEALYVSSFDGRSLHIAIMLFGKIIQGFAGWDVLGWVSENEVILTQNAWRSNHAALATGDIASGAVRQFYP